MTTLDNLMVPYIVPLVGITSMGLFCWMLSGWFPLLAGESRAHASSLPLDGLRGILASSVFFHHAYITRVFLKTGEWSMPANNFYAQLGPVAVTLFFFISGYLFWGKMLKDPASIRPARLWPNRARRILPAYWASVSVALLIVFAASGFALRQPVGKLVSGAGQWVLLGLPCQPDVNGVMQEQVTGGVYWTLRMELLFYLALPALAWFRRSWRVAILFAGAAFLNPLLHRISSHNGAILCTLDNLGTFTNALSTSFSFGMLAAYSWQRRFPAMERWLKSPWSAAIGLALVSVGLFRIPAGYTLAESLLLAPLFFAVVAGNSFFGVLTSRPMRCLGQISYSVYIFHALILFVLTRAWNARHPIASMALDAYWALILSIALAVVAVCTMTYWFVERPFLARRARRPASVPVSAGA